MNERRGIGEIVFRTDSPEWMEWPNVWPNEWPKEWPNEWL